MILKSIRSVTLFLLSLSVCAAQQKHVAITMDDGPLAVWSNNTSLPTITLANDKLLETITNKQIPITLFINEVGLIKNGETDQRISILKKWVDNPFITLGNHTYSHANYTHTSVADFKEEIIKGEVITKKLLEGSDKRLEYFRFPYNATGKDSTTRNEMQQFLSDKKYIATPFTIESTDYIFNTLYQDALDRNDTVSAVKIGSAYVTYTLTVFEYFEKLSHARYQRFIPQIYLCHVNALNAVYFHELTEQLKKRGYDFYDLKNILTDAAYKQKDYYSGPYGFSWFYRWEKDAQKRKELIRAQPDTPSEFYKAYVSLTQKSNPTK